MILNCKMILLIILMILIWFSYAIRIILSEKLQIKKAQHIAEVCGEREIVCVFDECFMDLADGYSMKEKVPVIKALRKLTQWQD